MKWNEFEQFIRNNRNGIEEPFLRKDILWKKVNTEFAPKRKNTKMVWQNTLYGLFAVLLGIVAVWGVHKYRELTTLNLKMATSEAFYENMQVRLIHNLDTKKLMISPEIEKDLIEIERAQNLLKAALKKAIKEGPDNDKDRLYNALLDTYELKTALLEKLICIDGKVQPKMLKNAANL